MIGRLQEYVQNFFSFPYCLKCALLDKGSGLGAWKTNGKEVACKVSLVAGDGRYERPVDLHRILEELMDCVLIWCTGF